MCPEVIMYHVYVQDHGVHLCLVMYGEGLESQKGHLRCCGSSPDFLKSE